MGFIAPSPPPVDVEEWKTLAASRADQAARPGLGGQRLRHALRRLPALHRQAGRLHASAASPLISATTPGLGGLGDVGDWWTEPIVFQKLVVWTLLWEILGLGCGSMPLTFRFLPPIGGILYWLRPGTVRLPPWPDRVPLTAGTRRTVVDVAPLRRRPGSAALPAASERRRAGRRQRRGPARSDGDRVLLGLLAAARAARQGLRSSPPGPRSTASLLVVFLLPARAT